MVSTQFFQSCLGVFQGGGCRGASLAGAYAAAIESGVHFAEVAGTSAGSIVAVLAGAGASPDFMFQQLKSMDFHQFLRKPEGGIPSMGWFGRNVVGLKSKELATVLKHGGLYSSSYIETWMDDLLAQLLPEARRPIRFQDLLRPTYVVAADVNGARPRVWSSVDTPNEHVSTAVRASCSLPFFFQAVQHGANKYVDGGVLSNLPLFVFSPGTGERRPRSNRILAFRLKGDYEQPDTSDLFAFTKAMTGVIVDGATELQCQLHRELQEVTLPTGKISATDFQKLADDKSGKIVQKLYDDGRKATLDFLANELVNVKSPKTGVVECEDEDAKYFEIIELGDQNPKEIVVVANSARWVWDLFPTLLNWTKQRISLRVYLGPSNGHPAETQRRQLLSQLCPNVCEGVKVPFEGFLFRSTEYGHSSAVVMRSCDEERGPAAAKYSGEVHDAAVSALFKSIEDRLTPTSAASTPSLVAQPATEYFERLKKGVKQYSNAEFSIDRVKVRDLLLTTSDIREYKYRQIVSFAQLYREHALTLFGPVQVAQGELRSLVTPPVVESTSNKNIVIQGNTRAAYCFLNAIEELDCIRVRGVNAPLPVAPVEIRRMRVVTQRKTPQFNYELFRKIEQAIRPYST